MYMRFVYLRVKPEKIAAFETFYENRVAPTPRQMKGCLFASLIQSEAHADECISMTLWNALEDAQDYEQSGRYDALIKENEPYLADSSEWRIQLSDDLTLEFKPVKEPPVVQAFPVATASVDAAPTEAGSSPMYLRIVSAKLRPGQFEAFRQHYTEEVIPALLAQKGCRYAYLTQGVEDDEILSVTLWDRKAYADAYELSGRFDQLIELAEPMLSSLFQWKMSLDPSQQATVATSDDLTVEGYHVVTCQSF